MYKEEIIEIEHRLKMALIPEQRKALEEWLKEFEAEIREAEREAITDNRGEPLDYSELD